MIEIYYELKVDGPGQYQLNPFAGWIRRAAAAASWGFVLPGGKKSGHSARQPRKRSTSRIWLATASNRFPWKSWNIRFLSFGDQSFPIVAVHRVSAINLSRFVDLSSHIHKSQISLFRSNGEIVQERVTTVVANEIPCIIYNNLLYYYMYYYTTILYIICILSDCITSCICIWYMYT